LRNKTNSGFSGLTGSAMDYRTKRIPVSADHRATDCETKRIADAVEASGARHYETKRIRLW
jgi:hypothetical protein